MKASKIVNGVFFIALFSLFSFSGAMGQEYDDMYYTSKDRKAEEQKRKAYRDSVKQAELELQTKNVNPDYMDRLGEYEEAEQAEEGYYDEQYADDYLTDQAYGNDYTSLDDIYWSDPIRYRNTVYDPFYRARMQSGYYYNGWYGYRPIYDRWAYDPFYDVYYGGVRVSYGWSWGYSRGWGYRSYYNPYNSWYYNSPFGCSPWSYRDYNTGYYLIYGSGSGYNTVVINNFENDNGIRRGRRVSRSSDYGRVAGTTGVGSNDSGRRPSSGRVDSSTPIQTRRTSSTYSNDSQVSSGRIASSDAVPTRGTTRTSSYNRGTYGERNMSSYTQRSTDRTLQRSTTSGISRPVSGTRSIQSTSTRPSSGLNRTNPVRSSNSTGINSDIRTRTYGSSNSLNRSSSSSIHRTAPSTRGSSNSSVGRNISRSYGSSNSSGSNSRSFSSGKSGSSSGYSSGSRSSGSSSSGVSRSSGSSSSKSSSSSSSKSGGSRKGGN